MKKQEIIDLIVEKLTAHAATVLDTKADDVESGVDLREYGMDSVGFTDLSERINGDDGLSLVDPTTFFSYPDLKSLAEYLVSEKWEVVTKKWLETGGDGSESQDEVKVDVAKKEAKSLFVDELLKGKQRSLTNDEWDSLTMADKKKVMRWLGIPGRS